MLNGEYIRISEFKDCVAGVYRKYLAEFSEDTE